MYVLNDYTYMPSTHTYTYTKYTPTIYTHTYIHTYLHNINIFVQYSVNNTKKNIYIYKYPRQYRKKTHIYNIIFEVHRISTLSVTLVHIQRKSY